MCTKDHATGLAERGNDNHTRLHASMSSAVNKVFVAASVVSSCAGRLAPTMAEEIPGCANTHATDDSIMFLLRESR